MGALGCPARAPPLRCGHTDRKARGTVLSFGVTFMLDPPVSRTVGWAGLAEERGFDAVWAWDSHVLGRSSTRRSRWSPRTRAASGSDPA